MASTQTTPTITLPNWSDSTAVAMYITSALSVVAALLSAFHPGFHLPSTVTQAVPVASVIIAAGAQIFNAVRQLVLHKTAITAGAVTVVDRSR